MYANTVIELIHPVTNQPFHIAVEICAEHPAGLLRKELENPNTNKPVMQFVLAASADARPDNICADYFIHVDSVNKPKIILADSADTINANCYELDARQPYLSVKGPLEPIEHSHFSLNKKIKDYVNNTLTMYTKSDDKFSLLIRDRYNQLKQELRQIDKNNSIRPDYTLALGKCRDELIEDMRSYTIKLDKLDNKSFSFFSFFENEKQTDKRTAMEKQLAQLCCEQLKLLIANIDKLAVDSTEKTENKSSPINKI